MAFKLVEDITEEEPEKTFGEKALSFGKEAARHAGRTASRIAETAAGTPGDILSLINEYIAEPIVSTVTGKKGPEYKEMTIGKILPTSQELRQRHEKSLGETVKSTNKIENFMDEVTSTATSLFSPGAAIKRGVGIGKGIVSSLTKSLGAQIAKEGVEDFTKDKTKSGMAHLGALTLLSFIDKKGAAKAISEGYKPLEVRAQQLNPVSANKLESNLQNLKTKMQKGSVAQSEKFIIDEVDAVLGKIKNGTITPEEAWALKRSLNEKLSKVLFETPYKSQPRARKLASIISNELDDALLLTKSQDPTFYKDLKGWNRAYKAMADSNVISKWVEKNLKYTPMTAGLVNMFGSALGTTASVAALPYQVGKIAYRMSKSPKLAKHYIKTISSAVAEDAATFNKQIKELDNEVQKGEKRKSKFKIVD